jgi:hypothetical protein
MLHSTGSIAGSGPQVVALTIGGTGESFYKPYNVTLDFTDMNVYIARGKAG